MSRGSKVRVGSLDCSTPPLVHISAALPVIPSCTDAEQVSVRDSPAMTDKLEWTILTVGGKGAVRNEMCEAVV